MVAIIGEADRDQVSELAKRHGINEQTIYAGTSFSLAPGKRRQAPEALDVENARLKKPNCGPEKSGERPRFRSMENRAKQNSGATSKDKWTTADEARSGIDADRLGSWSNGLR